MRRVSPLRIATLTLLSAAFIFACDSGGGAGDPNGIDPGTTDPGTTNPGTTDPGTTDPGTTDPGTTDPGTTDPGTTDPGTTDPVTVTPSYPATCTQTGFKTTAETFRSEQGVDLYQGVTSNTAPYDMVSIEIYGGAGSDAATGPATIDLNGSNYETCYNCVLVRKGCGTQSCEKTFYADAGKLVITGWSEDTGFTGHMEGVVLKEVTIDSNTYRSTPVAGGEEWCLDAHTFDATVTGPVVGGENTQPTCVDGGTGTLLQDNVANFSLPNCYGDMVTLHDTCAGASKALLLIGTAGWCEACHELLRGLVADHGGSMSRAIIDAQTPGLDMLIVLGENQYGNQPSQAYCQAYAEEHSIDPAMVVIDHNVGGLQVPLVDPAGYAIEVNSFATTWSNINPYLKAQGESVATKTPWMMLLNATNMSYAWNDEESTESLNAMVNALLAQ